MNSIVKSIGLSLLNRGISIFVRADILSTVKAGVLIMLNSDLDKEEKHKRVLQLVRDKEAKLAEDGVYDIEDRIATTWLDIAIKITYKSLS